MGGTGTVTAAKFIDSANSAYVLTPSATGNSLLVAGKVGIGTTGPGYMLDVQGTANISSTFTVGGVSGGVVPSGAIMFFNLTACPTGWTALTAAAGRVIVGRAANESIGSTVGATPLSSLEDRTHTHSFTPAGTFSGTAGTTGSGGVDHTHTTPNHTHPAIIDGAYNSYHGNTGGAIAVASNSNAAGQYMYATNQGSPVAWGENVYSGAGSGGAGTTSGSSAYLHTHPFTPAGTFSGTAGTTGTAATSNIIPYIQYLVCSKN